MYSPQDHGARCDSCPLQGEKVVPPSPVEGKRRLIVVGERPANFDVKLGKPFSGHDGQLLFDELKVAGIQKEDCHLTNATLCKGDGGDKELERATECCRPRLLKEIAEIPADVPLLTLGKQACHSVLNTRRLMYARGFVWKTPTIDEKVVAAAIRKAEREEKKNSETAVGSRQAADLLVLRAAIADRVCIPTIYPSFVLRADPWKPVLSVDIRRAGRAANGEVRLRAEYPHAVCGEAEVELIQQLISEMDDVVAADIETSGINVLKDDIVCLGISDGNTGVCIYPWNDVLAGVVQRELEKKKGVVFHNHTFDVACLTTHGMSFEKIKVEDSMVAFHAFASHLPKRLDFVTPMYADFPPWKLKFNRHGTEEKGGSGDISKLSPEDLCLYNIMDCYATIAAWRGMQKNLAEERKVYDNDMALSELCMRMQREGVLLDENVRGQISAAAKGEEMGKLFRLREITWPKFNPKIPRDMRRALFGKMGAMPLKGTASGLACTDKGVLQAIAGGSSQASEVARLALDWRYASKLRSTFIDGLETGPDGRIHPNWRGTGTISGRLSCSNPNLQQLPHDKKNYNPRAMYVAKPGYTYCYFDVKTAEIKFAAHLSGDKLSIEEAESSDCYVAAAKNLFKDVPGAVEVLNRDPKGAGKNLRQLAKMARLAANYLIVADSLYPKLRAAGVNIDLKQVERILQKIHSNYAGYFRFVENNIEKARKTGYIQDPILGRKRRVGFNPSGSEIANFPVQAGIAAVMTLRLLEIDARLPEGAKTVLQVHDSASFEVIDSEVETVSKLIAEVWDQDVVLANGAKFKLAIDQKIGKSQGMF